MKQVTNPKNRQQTAQADPLPQEQQEAVPKKSVITMGGKDVEVLGPMAEDREELSADLKLYARDILAESHIMHLPKDCDNKKLMV